MIPAFLSSKYRNACLFGIGFFIFAFLISLQYVVNYKAPYASSSSNDVQVAKSLIYREALVVDRPMQGQQQQQQQQQQQKQHRNSIETTSITRSIQTNSTLAKGQRSTREGSSSSTRKLEPTTTIPAPLEKSRATTNLIQISVNVTTLLSSTSKPINESATQIAPKALRIPGLETLKSIIPITANGQYILENPTLCSAVPDLSILVVVHTAPLHFDRRQNMRRTWTNNTYFSNLGLGQVRVLFLLGRVIDEKTQSKLEAEMQQYGDLLQGDFIDAYRNLTLKGVMGYKWMGERCRNVKMILKVDDDVLANTYVLLTEFLPKFEKYNRTIQCNHILTGTMPIIREKRNKWFVSHDQFRGHSFYPKYCSGFAVMLSADLPAQLHKAAFKTPFFWVDDVYLFGLLPGQLESPVKYESLQNRFTLNSNTAIQCLKNNGTICNFVIAGGADFNIVNTIWNLMSKQYHSGIRLQKEQSTQETPTSTSPSSSTSTPKIDAQAQSSSRMTEIDSVVKRVKPVV